MASRIQGPTCQVLNPLKIDEGTSARVCSPVPGPTQSGVRARGAVALDLLVFDEDQVTAFLRSVARTKTMARYVKVEWKSYDESAVINVIYALMPWKGKPGTVEVNLGDQKRIDQETSEETQVLLDTFVTQASQGPSQVTTFLKGQQFVRSSCLDTLNEAFETAKSLNGDVLNEARTAVRNLSIIKCAATIGLKTAALAGGALPGFVLGVGYDITLKVIKDWDSAPDGKLVAITSKVTGKVAKKAVKDASKAAAESAKGEAADQAKQAEWLAKRVAKAEDKLAGEATAKQLQKLARDTRRLGRATEGAARARWAARAFGSVKFLFYAKDVYDAFDEALETNRQAN